MKSELTEKITHFLEEKQGIAFTGNIPPLSWENLSRHCSEFLKKEIHLESEGSFAQHEKEKLLAGLGSYPALYKISIQSDAPVYLAFSNQEMEKFTAYFLSTPPASLLTSELVKGFGYYLILQLLRSSEKEEPLNHFSYVLEENVLPHEIEEGQMIKIALRTGDHTFSCRLIATQEALQTVQNYFASHKIPLEKHEKALECSLPLSCQLGHSDLNEEAWANAKVGDLLLVDEWLVDPTLLLEEVPLAALDQQEGGWSLKPLMPFESFPLHIETAPLHLSVRDLLDLAEGKSLSLPQIEEQSVVITREGKPLAKGSRLVIGNVAGIKIEELL